MLLLDRESYSRGQAAASEGNDDLTKVANVLE